MAYLHASIERPFQFLSAGQFLQTEAWVHPSRCLDSFEIIVGIEGTFHLHQGGVPYTVGPGTAMLLFPGVAHGGTQAVEEQISFYWCHFLCDEDDLVVNDSPVSGSGRIHLPTFFSSTNADRLHIIFNQLLHVANAGYQHSVAADYWLTCLLIELSEQVVSGGAFAGPSNRRLQAMLEWIRIHVDKPLTVSTLARHFNYHPDYLSRLFKREVGMGPQAYIHTTKLFKAKELLLKTDAPIKEIADTLGFQDAKHFMKLFKSYENITPSEYRGTYYKLHYNKV